MNLECSSLDELKRLAKGFKKNYKVRKSSIHREIKESKPRELKPERSLERARAKQRREEVPIKQDSKSFIVPGNPVGYYTHGKCPNWTRANNYYEYLKLVREYAELNGIILPLVASSINPCYIHIKAYFKTGVHSDPENVRKGISDALFYKKDCKGIGDKHCGGSFTHPMYDSENPRVEITIEYPYIVL